jgi:hypothetical protein
MKIKSQETYLSQLNFLKYFLFLIICLLAAFFYILALFRPPGSGSAFGMRIQIQTTNWMRIHVDPDPKHWFWNLLFTEKIRKRCNEREFMQLRG